MHASRTNGRALPTRALSLLLPVTLTGLLGLGCATSVPPPTAAPPYFQVQPQPTLTFKGQAATFTAGAILAESGTVTYQWQRNGVDVAGATGTTYTTPPTTLADAGVTFACRATHQDASTLSQGALLTVRPPLDLRFRLVGADLPPGTGGGMYTNILTGMERTFGNALGNPLEIGGTGGSAAYPYASCSWSFGVRGLGAGMTGFDALYFGGTLDALDEVLGRSVTGSGVITTLDIAGDKVAFGLSMMRSSQTGTFLPFVFATVPPGDLAARAALEAEAGRVITAASFQDGLVRFTSFGWSEGQGTPLEATAALATYDTIPAVAADLGARGYVITAFGAGNNGRDGFLLVGTRVKGVTTPRSVVVPVANDPAWSAVRASYSFIGAWFDPDRLTRSYLYER